MPGRGWCPPPSSGLSDTVNRYNTISSSRRQTLDSPHIRSIAAPIQTPSSATELNQKTPGIKYPYYINQLEKLEAAKAASFGYFWLPLVAFGCLSLPLVTFPYIWLPFLTFHYLYLALLGLILHLWTKLRIIGLLSQPKLVKYDTDKYLKNPC